MTPRVERRRRSGPWMAGPPGWAGIKSGRREAAATTLAKVSPMVCTLCGVCSHSREKGPSQPPVRSVATKPRTPQDKSAGYFAPSRPGGWDGCSIFLPHLPTFFHEFLVILNRAIPIITRKGG